MFLFITKNRRGKQLVSFVFPKMGPFNKTLIRHIIKIYYSCIPNLESEIA